MKTSEILSNIVGILAMFIAVLTILGLGFFTMYSGGDLVGCIMFGTLFLVIVVIGLVMAYDAYNEITNQIGIK